MMRVYSKQPSDEFIAQLRDVAIKAGAGALFIDVIDQLRGIEDEPAEIELLNAKIQELEDEIFALKTQIPQSA